MNELSDNPNIRILVIELWGLGDAVIMTAFLKSLPKSGVNMTVLCKPGSAVLLRPSYPEVSFIEFVAPWTAFRRKYHLWSWPWKKLTALIWKLRSEHFDITVSVRRDPRDALLMWLAGARKRCGIPRAGSQFLLNTIVKADVSSHLVENWWQLAGMAFPDQTSKSLPYLNYTAYHTPQPCWPNLNSRPLWLIHCGAGQPIRRWPEDYFAKLVQMLRERYDFQLGIIIDSDGAGTSLSDIADFAYKPSSIGALVQCLNEADLLIANDSGPGHIMAALEKPVISIFGSQKPEWFRPYGDQVQVIKLSPAPSPPLFDSGGQVERCCLTELSPEIAFTEIQQYLDRIIVTV